MPANKTRQSELLGLKLMQVSDGLQTAASSLFKAHGLSAPQYNVLRILRGAGAEALRCQEIADRMTNRVPDITRLLDRLVEKGLANRRRSTSDRRVVKTVITTAGSELLQSIDQPLDNQIADHFYHCRVADLEQLDALLDRILAGLGEPHRES